MAGLSRRKLLAFSGVHIGLKARSVAAIGFALLTLTPRRANAEPVTICLAIASAVAGIVAANNRSDGGLSGILNASLGYLRTMSDQLLSLQRSMAEVLTELSRLDERLRDAFEANRLREMQEDLGSALVQYESEAVRAQTFEDSGGFDAWRKNASSVKTLEDVDSAIRNALGKIRFSQYYDPLTAVYVTGAVGPALSVRYALGEARQQMRARGQEFLDIYERVEDPTQLGSTAAKLARHAAEYERLKAELVKRGVDLSTDYAADWRGAVEGAVSIQHYLPVRKVGERQVCGYEVRAIPPSGFALVALREPPIPRSCHPVAVYAPEDIGGQTTFLMTAPVTRQFVTSTSSSADAAGFVIKQYAISNAVGVHAVNPDVDKIAQLIFPLGVPVYLGKPAPQERRDARSEDDKLRAVSSTPQFTDAELRRSEVNEIINGVNGLNFQIASMGLCVAALAAVSTSRAALFKFFEDSIA